MHLNNLKIKPIDQRKVPCNAQLSLFVGHLGEDKILPRFRLYLLHKRSFNESGTTINSK